MLAMKNKIIILVLALFTLSVQGCSNGDFLDMSEKIDNIESVFISVDNDDSWLSKGVYKSGKLYSKNNCYLVVYNDDVIKNDKSISTDGEETKQLINGAYKSIVINGLEFYMQELTGYPEYSLIKEEHDSMKVYRTFNTSDSKKLIVVQAICSDSPKDILSQVIKLN